MFRDGFEMVDSVDVALTTEEINDGICLVTPIEVGDHEIVETRETKSEDSSSAA